MLRRNVECRSELHSIFPAEAAKNLYDLLEPAASRAFLPSAVCACGLVTGKDCSTAGIRFFPNYFVDSHLYTDKITRNNY